MNEEELESFLKLEPEVIKLNKEQWERFTELLEGNKPPTPASIEAAKRFKEMMNAPTPWKDE